MRLSNGRITSKPLTFAKNGQNEAMPLRHISLDGLSKNAMKTTTIAMEMTGLSLNGIKRRRVRAMRRHNIMLDFLMTKNINTNTIVNTRNWHSAGTAGQQSKGNPMPLSGVKK